MAIFKTQPMRSAEIALVDTVNAQGVELENQQRSVISLAGDIEAEATSRENGDNALITSLSATNRQVLLLGEEVTDNAQAIASLQAFNNLLKIGKVADIDIPANTSISTSYVFEEPFPATAACILIAQVITDELATLFDFTLIDCTYSGFSYSISNSDADPHRVALGFVALNVNTIE